MIEEIQPYDFPKQKVATSEKKKAKWYARCTDWIISQAQACKDKDELETKYEILNGNIPDKFYKKILNPYNATKEKYTRFPATMRNYDMMKGIIRRYISEYIKNPHDFIVGANNPEVVLARNAKLRQELQILVERKIAERIQANYQEWINGGNDPKQFNPQESLNIEEFIKEFNENYIDDISIQGQKIFNVIKDITDDNLLYARAYNDWVSMGECYTYTDVVGEKLIKRVVSPLDAYPIPTDNIFREDDDMFCERRKLTYQQIIDEFDEYLTNEQIKFLESYYAKTSNNASYKAFKYKDYEEMFPDVCKKYTTEQRNMFIKESIMERDKNTNLFDVWHVVWKGDARKAIVTFVNKAGFIDNRVEEDNYKLNKEAGDIDIDYIFEPQVYESVRIGTYRDAIYPYGARAIAYNRDGKLPYNGINELLPGLGKFSIVEILTPFQIFYNIVSYHREMVIAKNKLTILIMAKSLLGKEPEDTLYRMIADGTLLIDDTNDPNMLKAQQIREINTSMGDYIDQLTQLLNDIEDTAKNQVDMTAQRYGEIANSAGKGVTDEAINRGSMGTVIVEFLMDCMRARDYNRDMDFSKLAWIDGLNTSYRDENNNMKYISLDVNSHNYADYIIKCKNSVEEKEKLTQLQNYAFSAAQNGDNMMAIAAIEGDSVEAISKLIKKYQEQKDAHEQQMQEIEQQTEQMKQQFELEKIHAKGEEDRKTKELEGYIDKEIELIKSDTNMISFNAEMSEKNKQESLNRLDAARDSLEREKINVAREKNMLDAFSKEKDRQVKIHDINTKLKIAKTNKNKYDNKSSK